MFAVNNEDDVRIKFSDFLKMPDPHQQSKTCPDGGEVEFWAAGDHRGGACSSQKRQTTGQMASKVSLRLNHLDSPG